MRYVDGRGGGAVRPPAWGGGTRWVVKRPGERSFSLGRRAGRDAGDMRGLWGSERDVWWWPGHGRGARRGLSIAEASRTGSFGSSEASSSSSSSGSSRPRLRPHVVIVVEGMNDARNVLKYVDVDVYVLGSATKTGTRETQEALRGLQRKYRRVVLLLDPDVAGRQARNDIDQLLGGEKCWHAFIPTMRAILEKQTRYKDVGDVGVEHAGGEAVRQAILRSRLSRRGVSGGRDGQEGRRGGEDGKNGALPFGRDTLISLGLVAEMGVRGGDVTRRRELVCAWLGIGMSDGKQLLRQLNMYGFTMADLNDALGYAERVLSASSDAE